jgi:hypothetical protein
MSVLLDAIQQIKWLQEENEAFKKAIDRNLIIREEDGRKFCMECLCPWNDHADSCSVGKAINMHRRNI